MVSGARQGPRAAWLLRHVVALSLCCAAAGFVAPRPPARIATEQHVSGSALPPAWLQAIERSKAAAPPAADANAVSAPPGLDAASRVVAAAPGRTMRVASLDDLGPLAEHRLKIFRNIVPTKIPSRTYDTIFENLVASMRRRFFRKGTYILVATRDEDALAPVRRETLMGNLELSCHSLQGFSKANPDDPIDTWYLTEMAVASTFRRLGVATDLLRSSELLAAKKGIRELLLHVEVENTGAVALYEKAGFEILPQTPKVLSFAGQMGLLDPVYAMKRYHLMWKKVDS